MKPALRRIIRDEHTVQYGVHPLRAVMLSGLTQPVRQWIERLDGTRDLKRVLRDASDAGLDELRARSLLDQLAAQGALHDAATSNAPLSDLPLAERDRLRPDLDALDLASTAPDGGIALLARRRKLRVRVYGAGRVGAQIVTLLAACGVGNIRVIDPGQVRPCDIAPGGLTWAEIGLTREDGAAAVARRLAYTGPEPTESDEPTYPHESADSPQPAEPSQPTPPPPRTAASIRTPTATRSPTPSATRRPSATATATANGSPSPDAKGQLAGTDAGQPSSAFTTPAPSSPAAVRSTALTTRAASATAGVRPASSGSSGVRTAASSSVVRSSGPPDQAAPTTGPTEPAMDRGSKRGQEGGRKVRTRAVGKPGTDLTSTSRPDRASRPALGADPGLGSEMEELMTRPSSVNVLAGGSYLGDRSETIDLVILAPVGPLDGVLVNELTVLGIPHLLASAFEGHGIVGPLVLPGKTACLHCLDLTRRDYDPAWPMVTARLGGYPPGEIACDATLSALVAAQAVGHALAHLDGKESVVTNGTMDVTPDWRWKRRSWNVHPQCRCMRNNPYSLTMVSAPNHD
ncbi:ThiF family protein [Nonomuraea jiangxiensis]|uniref:ThiF family protein n=1 Tax=Nonomuraea jiangxiensis TaxID=633440 RepID=A0A1G8N4U7_9ACTN|nr:ThiF family protein [Nonomuraea jiangxiensis]